MFGRRPVRGSWVYNCKFTWSSTESIVTKAACSAFGGLAVADSYVAGDFAGIATMRGSSPS
jgi:hypothetical protein